MLSNNFFRTSKSQSGMIEGFFGHHKICEVFNSKLRAHSKPTLSPSFKHSLHIVLPMYQHLIIFCLLVQTFSTQHSEEKTEDNLASPGTRRMLQKKNGFHSFYKILNSGMAAKIEETSLRFKVFS